MHSYNHVDATNDSIGHYCFLTTQIIFKLIVIKPALANELSLSQTIVRGIFLLNANPEYHRVGAYPDG